MLQTGLVAHERYFWHDPGSGAGFSGSNPFVQPDQHPETPESKRRLLALLEVSGLGELVDPYLEELMRMGGQELQPHQAAAVDAAAALVRNIPQGQ
jgi:hypothetical protein